MGIPELDMCGKTLLAENPITIPPEIAAKRASNSTEQIYSQRTLQMAIAGLP
jgi:hypothetical protein